MQNDLAVSMIITAWKGQNKKLDEMIASYGDEQWRKETSPGRNTGYYLLGHLAAVNDHIIQLLGLGNRLHPELEEPFLKKPDRSGTPSQSIAELKACWKEINDFLYGRIAAMQPADWFEPHTAVSAEDFAKEPHRNKLNILISRTVHQGYHLGQLTYLK